MNELLQRAWQVRLDNFSADVDFPCPSKTLPVSLSGTACALDCAHCGRHYLRHMVPVQRAGSDRRLPDATSLLISGGCDPTGRVPAVEHLEAVCALRSGRRLNWHLGLVDAPDLATLRPYLDCVSFDFVGDNDTIHEVYGLDRTVDDYAACYQMLRNSVPVVPHVTIGLHGGEIRGERAALQRIAEIGAAALVLLVFIPTRGTRFATRSEPNLDYVVALLAEARIMFPNIQIALGCMRPGGAYRRRLDPLALKAGMNRIANPSATAVQMAGDLGLDIQRSDECCVF